MKVEDQVYTEQYQIRNNGSNQINSIRNCIDKPLVPRTKPKLAQTAHNTWKIKLKKKIT
jgi:hypothetical protein